MGEMIKEQLSESLKLLHLPALVANYPQQGALACAEGRPYDRYLSNLCRLELDEREQRKVRKLLAASRLPREKTLGGV